MVINFKKLNENAIMPTYGTDYSAGCDLYACTSGETITIRAGSAVKIGIGISVEIPVGYFGAVFARSGMAANRGLRPSNCVGVIDADYRGEIIVSLRNDSDEDAVIYDGDRIAQLVVLPFMRVQFREVEELTDTARGAGGFGSTGVSKDSAEEG